MEPAQKPQPELNETLAFEYEMFKGIFKTVSETASRLYDSNKMLKHSDLIVVCISYLKNNHNYVDKKFFSKMKKNSIFVNTSRGEVVNETDLINALRTKKIKCALVDVIKNEQFLNIKKNMLIEYAKNNSNLIISPHMAGLTIESEKKAFLISVNNIISYFKNEN